MSEMTYLQKRLALKNGQIQSTDAKKASPGPGNKPPTEDQPKAEETAEKVGKPGKPAKKGSGKKIKSASKKRAKQNRQYTPVKKKFLEEHPICEVEGCQAPSTDLHHQKGRAGKQLLKVEDFMALCRPHHDQITEESKAAIAAGHSKSRLGKPQKPTT